MRNPELDSHVSRPMHGHAPGSLPRFGLLAALLLAVAACGSGGSTPNPEASGCATPEPMSSGRPGCGSSEPLSPAVLRLILIDELGPRWYCDPDVYPVAHGSEQQRAIEQWPEVVAENELMRAIAARLNIDVDEPVSDAGKLAIYRQWKVAVSIPLDGVDASHFRFDYLAAPVGDAPRGRHTVGTIDDQGRISVEQQSLADAPMCPI